MHVDQFDLKRDGQRSRLRHQITVARDAQPATYLQRQDCDKDEGSRRRIGLSVSLGAR